MSYLIDLSMVLGILAGISYLSYKVGWRGFGSQR